MDDTQDYRLIAKIKNNRILSAIENAGFKTVGAFCVSSGFSPSSVGELVNLRKSPLLQNGSGWRELPCQLADALGVLVEDLFSEAQKTLSLHRNVAEKTFGEKQMLRMVDESPETLLLENEMKETMTEVLDELTPLQRDVLIMRFGLDGKPPLTLEEAGTKYDLSRTRIMQIESCAVRKLRHPSRSEKLREYLDLTP